MVFSPATTDKDEAAGCGWGFVAQKGGSLQKMAPYFVGSAGFGANSRVDSTGEIL